MFFGPVGFTEQCVATRAKTLQEENNIKPLSPLTGEQVVEIFKEATKIALRLEKISSTQSPVSTSSSSKSSLSSSILKLSSTNSESPSWLTGKLSSGSSEGTSLSQFELDFDKENIQPFSINKENFDKDEQIPSASNSEQVAPAMSEKEKITNYTDGKIMQNGNFDKEITLNANQKRTSVILGEQIISDNTEDSKTVQKNDIFESSFKQISNEENLNVAKNEQEKIEISAKESEQLNGEKVQNEVVTEQKVQNGMKEIKSNKIPVVRAIQDCQEPRILGSH